MHNLKCRIGKVGNLVRYGWHCVSQSRKGSRVPSECLPDANFSSLPRANSLLDAKVGMQPLFSSQPNANSCLKYENLMKAHGISVLFGRSSRKVVPSQSQNELITLSRWHHNHLGSVRTLASGSASETSERKPEERQKVITTVEDPFDAPTYNIPEKPVTFTEGASYSLVILAGLGIAGVAAYAVVTELILEPKEYKVFSKALERVQSDSQVRVRIGSPVKGYGQESRNRAARQRIPNRTWTDEDGVEHVEVNFHVRGPQGAGVVYTEMFKDKADKQWKYTYLMVEIRTPSPVQLLLESYVPS